MSERRLIWRFLGLVFVLLPVMYTFWYLLHPWLIAPVSLLCQWLLPAWLPGAVDSVQMEGANMLLFTPLGEERGQLVAAEQAGYQLVFHFDTRIVSYAIPFYAALIMATPVKERLDTFFRGLLLLYPLVLFGVVAVALKNLMVGLAGHFPPVDAGWVPGPNTIALCFQLGTLMVPPVAPVVIWGWQSRDTDLLDQMRQLLPVRQRPA